MDSFTHYVHQQQQQLNYTQFHLPPPPPDNTNQRPAHTNTFVHKLYNMVVDTHFQHLISWSYSGTSFIVCNIMEFSRDVLPKHFKHNNFSSFVRQLNMYGFHKVNKSPRGHRTLAENQIWEFSHAKFLRNRPDLLDDIKRKSVENEGQRKDSGDVQAHVALLQNSQSDMLQQIHHLYENFSQVVKELQETKQKQSSQMQTIKTMLNYISRQNGGHLPDEFRNFESKQDEDNTPSILVTSHDQSNLLDVYRPMNRLGYSSQLPPSPSPTMMVSDDDCSLYSPKSPHTPHHSRNNSAATNYYMNTLDPMVHQ